MYRADEAHLHDMVVAAVATRKLRFRRRPELKTYSNIGGRRNMGLFENGSLVYPDVVVVDTTNDRADKIGEIETPHSINYKSAEQWLRYSRLAPRFFLYVPAGFEREAVRLLNRYTVQISGLRTYTILSSGVVFANVQVTPGPPYSIREIRPPPPREPPIRPKREQDK